MRYRKKPVVVEAWQWDGKVLEECENVPEWIWDAYKKDIVSIWVENGETTMEMYFTEENLEITHEVFSGDYIIQSQKGELYMCKENIFLETYEKL